jgi:hypothetical protein
LKQNFISSSHLLLPSRCKLAGWILFIPALIITILRFYFEYKPEWLDTKVFAFYSSYFENKYFTIIENNISEEITGVLLLISLFLISFSREKREDEEFLIKRLHALLLSVYINTIFLLIAFIFVYGLGFVKVLFINIYSIFIIYIVIFQMSLGYNIKFPWQNKS